MSPNSEDFKGKPRETTQRNVMPMISAAFEAVFSTSRKKKEERKR
jgi:hypothetical protein